MLAVAMGKPIQHKADLEQLKWVVGGGEKTRTTGTTWQTNTRKAGGERCYCTKKGEGNDGENGPIL